jgi:hypothetical protein
VLRYVFRQRGRGLHFRIGRRHFHSSSLGRAKPLAEQLAAGENDPLLYHGKIATARFDADHFLIQVAGLSDTTRHDAAGVMALSEEQF